jgi:hypothetical protein
MDFSWFLIENRGIRKENHGIAVTKGPNLRLRLAMKDEEEEREGQMLNASLRLSSLRLELHPSTDVGARTAYKDREPAWLKCPSTRLFVVEL